MARASYVYVLTQYGQVFGTFTVKHELWSAVLRNIPAHLYGEYKVTRYSDGNYGWPAEPQPLKEFMQ